MILAVIIVSKVLNLAFFFTHQKYFFLHLIDSIGSLANLMGSQKTIQHSHSNGLIFPISLKNIFEKVCAD